jgi:hypothetical protein
MLHELQFAGLMLNEFMAVSIYLSTLSNITNIQSNYIFYQAIAIKYSKVVITYQRNLSM